jgi:hypothetical protein
MIFIVDEIRYENNYAMLAPKSSFIIGFISLDAAFEWIKKDSKL